MASNTIAVELAPCPQTIPQDFEAWRTRSLAACDVLHLFVDGMHLDVGDRESYKACVGFLRNMIDRGLRDPLLSTGDDCPGLRKALKAVWPKSLPQECAACL